MSASLSIVVVEPDRDRALLIVDSLRDAGSYDIHVISEPTGLARRIQALSPDVVLIDVESPSRDTLEELALASGPLDRPVAMFVDRDGEGLTDMRLARPLSEGLTTFAAFIVFGLLPLWPLAVLGTVGYAVWRRLSPRVAV